jgi:hypothetical protein
MNCEDLQPDYTAWALGIAGEPERSEIAAHLARQCPNCVPGVSSALTTVAAMSGAVKVSQPPDRLRKRIMASIERQPSRLRLGTFLPWAITAMVSVALLAIGITGRRTSGDTPRLQQALSILNDPSTRDISFGETEKPSRGRVFVSPSKGVVFIGASLPSIGTDKTFELWILPAKGNPVPAGLFRSQSDATAVYVHPGPVENVSGIAVTVEPTGGSAQPTTTPFIVTKL